MTTTPLTQPTGRELVEEWVTELKSGRWRQGHGFLATRITDSVDGEDHPKNFAYCCLGVLCEVLVRRGLLSRLEPNPLQERTRRSYGDTSGEPGATSQTVLPIGALRALNDTTLARPITDLGRIPLALRGTVAQRNDTLVALNDHERASFDRIASVVRDTFLSETAV